MIQSSFFLSTAAQYTASTYRSDQNLTSLHIVGTLKHECTSVQSVTQPTAAEFTLTGQLYFVVFGIRAVVFVPIIPLSGNHKLLNKNFSPIKEILTKFQRNVFLRIFKFTNSCLCVFQTMPCSLSKKLTSKLNDQRTAIRIMTAF